MTDKSRGTNDPLCDIGPTPFGDGIVDMKDLAVLTQCCVCTTCSIRRCSRAGGSMRPRATSPATARELWNGTLVGNPMWQPDAGAVGGAIQLDGIDDHVLAGAPIDVATRRLSLFAWVKGGKPGQVILSQSNGVNWLVADARAGRPANRPAEAPTRTSRTLSSQTVITDGNWHRIGLTGTAPPGRCSWTASSWPRTRRIVIKPAYGNRAHRRRQESRSGQLLVRPDRRRPHLQPRGQAIGRCCAAAQQDRAGALHRGRPFFASHQPA